MNYQLAMSLNASLSQFNQFIYTHIILQERSKGWVNMAGKSTNQIPCEYLDGALELGKSYSRFILWYVHDS